LRSRRPLLIALADLAASSCDRGNRGAVTRRRCFHRAALRHVLREAGRAADCGLPMTWISKPAVVSDSGAWQARRARTQLFERCRYRRLFDPACGSITGAVIQRRFLRASRKRLSASSRADRGRLCRARRFAIASRPARRGRGRTACRLFYTKVLARIGSVALDQGAASCRRQGAG